MKTPSLRKAIDRKNQYLDLGSESGFSVVELGIAVAVLLILGGMVYLNSPAWRNGAYRADCLNNMESVQKAMRQHADTNEIAIGGTIASTDLIGANQLIPITPVCRAGGTYTFSATVPAIGTAYATCSLGATQNHVPTAQMVRGW